MKLIISCIECGAAQSVAFEDQRIATRRLYTDHRWILSLVSPPGTPVVLAPLCPACAKKTYPPHLLKAAIKRIMAEEEPAN